MSVGDIILLVMAVILPPLPVAIKRGVCSGAFWLNLLLSILAYLPGMIHAWYIILKYPEHIPTRPYDSHQQAQRDLERNPINGTFPGHVYQSPVNAGAGPSVYGSGNMDGVYGQQQQQSGKAATYGTTQPPAYSPK